MKPQYFIFIFVLAKDLKHYLSEVPTEMTNEAPKSEILVTAKSSSI
jgi:hypothetical protein